MSCPRIPSYPRIEPTHPLVSMYHAHISPRIHVSCPCIPSYLRVMPAYQHVMPMYPHAHVFLRIHISCPRIPCIHVSCLRIPPQAASTSCPPSLQAARPSCPSNQPSAPPPGRTRYVLCNLIDQVRTDGLERTHRSPSPKRPSPPPPDIASVWCVHPTPQQVVVHAPPPLSPPSPQQRTFP